MTRPPSWSSLAKTPGEGPPLRSPPGTAASCGRPDCGVDERLGPAHQGVQVCRTPEAFRVDLVDILSAGRPGREPPARGDDLEAVDGRTIAACPRQLRDDWIAGERLVPDGVSRERLQARLLRHGGGRVDARI